MRALALSVLFALSMAGCSPEPAQQESASEASSSPAAETASTTATTTSDDMPVASSNGNPVIVMDTSMGAITAELWADKAPITVENFLRYVDGSFFDGLTFHRVIDGFMIQGGGYGPDLVEKSTFEPIKNEARSDTPNNRGTLAMARTSVIDSATSQFFINLVDNSFLNHADETNQGFGYAVFGNVISGMDVVDAIAKVATGTGRFGFQNVPTEPVVINSVRRQ